MQLLDLASELMDLARENSELKSELARVRQEAKELQRLLSVVSQTSNNRGEHPSAGPRSARIASRIILMTARGIRSRSAPEVFVGGC